MIIPQLLLRPQTGLSAKTLTQATLISTLLLGGCNLIDQRTFNPNAGKPPVPYSPPAPPVPPEKPPFLQIESGTPESEYGPDIDRGVHAALSRKPNVLFIVQMLVPAQPDPAAQVKVMTDATHQMLEPIAHRILTAGAQPIQVDMHTVATPGIQHPTVRVTVR